MNTLNSKLKIQFLSVLTLMFSIGWIWLSRVPDGPQRPLATAPYVGFMAPDFQLQALDGQEYSLSGLRGRPILLNIWASWCPPCRSEMPAMQQLHQDYFEQGFIILAVNATNQDDLTAAKDFISSRGLSFPILLDTEGNVSSLYQVRSLPTSFFIDTSGRIHEIIIGGPMAEALMRVRAEHLLLGVRP